MIFRMLSLQRKDNIRRPQLWLHTRRKSRGWRRKFIKKTFRIGKPFKTNSQNSRKTKININNLLNNIEDEIGKLRS